jgi:hyaluronan synthase
MCGSIYLHDDGALTRIIADPALLGTWTVTLAFIVLQLVLAWSQKPVTVSQREQAGLDQLFVTVVIPCYNEDPRILDRTIVSLFCQTRLPDHIEVVDDGSSVDYSAVRDFWLAQRVPSVCFTWVRQRNAGKKHAQAVTFTSDRHADIFVTIDSDSALDRHAIAEGLKPFADRRVVSVAGLETAININRNLLTRAIGHRSLVFQLFAMSAQSVARGSVLINPGAFSLYRAPMIRKIVPSYLGETFFGVPVTLGDDTALTLYALLHGRAVHQPTAVSLPVYPETLAHHLRQWTRWMRASTIRMLWRLRYLPVLSYGWIFTLYTIGSFLFSVAMTIAIPLAWPGSEKLLLASLAAMVIWPLSISLRLATVRRSDQGIGSRLAGVALLPAAALWYVVVLRQIRFYGIATCWRQGWVTRQHVEVTLDGSYEPLPAQHTPPAAGRQRGGEPRRAQMQRVVAGDPHPVRDPRARPEPGMRPRDPRGNPGSSQNVRGVRPAGPGRGSTERAAAQRQRPMREFGPDGRPRPPQDPQAGSQWPVQDPARRHDLRNGGGPRAFRDSRAPGSPRVQQPVRPAVSQDNRWPGPGRPPGVPREDLGRRPAGSVPPGPPRNHGQERGLPATSAPPARGPWLPPGMAPGRGHDGHLGRDPRQAWDGFGSRPGAPFVHDRSLAPDGGPPPDQGRDPAGQGWAALDQRARREPRDQNGSYAKEHRP